MISSGDLAPQCHPETECITCGDEGVEMTVLEVDVARALARCAGAHRSPGEVDLGIVSGPIQPGDVLLVHAGVALTRVAAEVTA